MSIIEWKSPPRNEEDDLNDLAEELRNRPDEWALVALNAWTGGDGSCGIVDDLRDRGLEVKSILSSGVKGTMGARHDVYARFVPEWGR